MKPATYKVLTLGSKSHVILRTVWSGYHERHLTTRIPGKLKSLAGAEMTIERQVAEDAEWRLRRINEYLAERRARPAPAAEASNQIEMF